MKSTKFSSDKEKCLKSTGPHRVRFYVYIHAHVYVSNLQKLPTVVPPEFDKVVAWKNRLIKRGDVLTGVLLIRLKPAWARCVRLKGQSQ